MDSNVRRDECRQLLMSYSPRVIAKLYTQVVLDCNHYSHEARHPSITPTNKATNELVQTGKTRHRFFSIAQDSDLSA